MNTPDVSTPIKTMCPKCHNPIEVNRSIKVQDVISCPKCKISLEVISKLPLTLSRVDMPTEYDSRRLFKR